MSLELTLPEIPTVQFAIDLASQSEVYAAYFERPEVLEKLRDSISDPVLFAPVRTDSFANFCASYLTVYITSRPDWLALIFRKSRFDVLVEICKREPELCRQVLPYIDSLPLTVFQEVWRAVGSERELHQVLNSTLLETFEKEDRVVFALRERPIRAETAYILCLDALCTAPFAFAELASAWPAEADRVINNGLSFDRDVTPVELANLERSLVITQGSALGVKDFSRRLLEQCLVGAFSYERTMTAWGLFRRHHDPKADRNLLSSLLRHLRLDNQLWFVHNLLHFYNYSL